MTAHPLLAALTLALFATHALPARADAWRPPFVDPYSYFTEDAQYEAWYTLRAGLELGFEAICGDTFCEGDYANITPLRFQSGQAQAEAQVDWLAPTDGINRAPVITSLPPLELHQAPFRYAIQALDPNGDVLSYELTDGPAGASPHAEAPPFRTLHERYDVGDLEEALVEGLVSGHPDMPEFEFEPEQAEAIVAYLRSLE